MERESGWRDEKRREGSWQGNGGWMVVWQEDQTHCHAEKNHPLHPPHPEPCIPTTFFFFFFPPIFSTWKGQTSTDWIWFICARIIWTLLRIFFWWPANVTPTLRMSLWWDRSRCQATYYKQSSIYQSFHLFISFSIRMSWRKKKQNHNLTDQNENKA